MTLAWDPSTDSDVVSYSVHYGTRSGVYTETVTVTETLATLPNLVPGTYYCVVTATNTAGLESLPSDELSFTVDSSAPTLEGLVDGASLNGPSSVNLQLTESATPYTKVEVYADDAIVAVKDSGSQTVVWQNAQPGDHRLQVKAYDASGQSMLSVPVEVHIVAPTVRIANSLTDNATVLTVVGAPGRMQHVYVSDDLETWTLLNSEVNTTGTLTFSDDTAGSVPQRFYRVIAD